MAFGRVALDLGRERRPVHGVGATVNLQQQREAAIGFEVRRPRDPGLDGLAVVAGLDLDLLDGGQVQMRQYIGIEGRQGTGLGPRSGDRNIGWLVG